LLAHLPAGLLLGAAGDKPIAIGECQFKPSLDNLKQQPKWLYAMLWPDFYGNNPNLSALYNSEPALTEDEMPGWKRGADLERPQHDHCGAMMRPGAILAPSWV
jgi:hypothetical protein